MVEVCVGTQVASGSSYRFKWSTREPHQSDMQQSRSSVSFLREILAVNTSSSFCCSRQNSFGMYFKQKTALALAAMFGDDPTEVAAHSEPSTAQRENVFLPDSPYSLSISAHLKCVILRVFKQYMCGAAG